MSSEEKWSEERRENADRSRMVIISNMPEAGGLVLEWSSWLDRWEEAGGIEQSDPEERQRAWDAIYEKAVPLALPKGYWEELLEMDVPEEGRFDPAHALTMLTLSAALQAREQAEKISKEEPGV